MEKEPIRFPEIPSDDEVERICLTIRRSKSYPDNLGGDFIRKRDENLIILYATCGLRPGECLNLRWSDIDFEERKININPYWNKQRNARPARFPLRTKELLLDFLEFSRRFIVSEFIFPGLSTLEPMTTSAFGKRLRGILREAGLQKEVGRTRGGNPIYKYKPYSLRKYYGNRIRQRSGIVAAKEALRHNNISTTLKFYSFVDDEEVLDGVDNAFN